MRFSKRETLDVPSGYPLKKIESSRKAGGNITGVTQRGTMVRLHRRTETWELIDLLFN